MNRSGNKNDNNWKGILTLAIVTVISFGVVFAVKGLSKDENQNNKVDDVTQESTKKEILDISGWDTAAYGVSQVEALKTDGTLSGYLVEVASKGYAGDVKMSIRFNAVADKVEAVTILSHTESEGIGSKITEAAFLNQFQGTKLPVYLQGMNVTSPSSGQAGSATPVPTATVAPTAKPDATVKLLDGTYHSEGKEFYNGYKDVMDMEVKNGVIVSLTWDNIAENGELKRKLSMNGEYVMTENGPRWDEQADALAAYVLEHQSAEGITMNEEGKTDAVSSVSIGVTGFVSMVNNCFEQALGKRVVLKDGTYHSEGKEFYNGYKDVMDMEVKNGAIVSLTWDNIAENGDLKRKLSMDGKYVMTENGPRWDEQADALAAYVLEHQSTEGITMNEEGKTDAVSSVSIGVAGFVSMVNDCFTQASGKSVALKDGTYHAEGTEYHNGYKDVMDIEVKNGAIVSLTWDNIAENGDLKRKLSMDGEYVMTENGPRWDEQADALAAYVLEHQSTEGITMNEEGKTDSVAGVSIGIGGFISMIENCLTQAAGIPVQEPTAVPTTEPEKEVQPEKPEGGTDMSGTQVDAVSNATYSSKAVINGINNAYFILDKYVLN